MDRMAAIVGNTPTKLGKMTAFTADMSTKMTSIPTGMGKPVYVPSHGVSFR